MREQVGALEVWGWGRRLDWVITEKRIMFAGQIKVLLKLLTMRKNANQRSHRPPLPPAVLSGPQCRPRESSRTVGLI